MLLTFTAGLLCACSYGPTAEDKAIEQGYTCRVVYDANGGKFGESAQSVEVLVKPDSLIPSPDYVDEGTQASIKVPTRLRYTLSGWYKAQTDEDGNILYEGEGEEKEPVLSDTEWDFKKDKVTDDITLVAKWERDRNFIIVAMSTDENGNEVKRELRVFKTQQGATIGDKLYETDVFYGEAERRPDRIRINNSSELTILEFYEDKELTEVFDLHTTHPGGDVFDYEIYVKYLNGKYTFVSEESKNISLTAESRWYLLENVDLSNKEWTAATEFNGSIYGNGYTISGIKIKSKAQRPSAGADFVSHSIFGRMNGKVENLTFKDVTFSVTASAFLSDSIGAQKISFLASEFGENGLFSDVTLENCQIELVNKEKYEPQLNSDSKYYWNVSGDKTQEEYIAKQKVTGVVTVTEREDMTIID